MGTLDQEVLELIRAVQNLAPEEEPFFATAEDCNYFRSIYRALPLPSPQPQVVVEMKLAPKPVKRETPPPPPLVPVVEKTVAAPRAPDSFDDLRHLFGKIAPQIRIVDNIPSDGAAKMVSERWKTRNLAAPISLLFYQEPPQHRLLLEHLAEALDVVFGNARLIQCASIEKEKQWDAFLSVPGLKTVIICDAALWQLPNLLQFYREVPSHSERFLQNTPVFLLPDLSLYLKDPLLKRSLWKALCQKIG